MQCHKCYRSFASYTLLCQHSILKHSSDIRVARKLRGKECPECNLRLSSIDKYNIHVWLEHDYSNLGYKDVYRCGYIMCDFRTTNDDQLRQHIRSQHLTRRVCKWTRYHCPRAKCNRVFKRLNYLQKHLLKH